MTDWCGCGNDCYGSSKRTQPMATIHHLTPVALGGFAWLTMACGPSPDQLYSSFDNGPGTAEPPLGASLAPPTPAPRYSPVAVKEALDACRASQGQVESYASPEAFASLVR